MVEPENRYSKARAKRDSHVQDILKSGAGKKVVVAGPGTGKTYLFREILKGKNETLTLTFVNALVEDLSLELYGTSKVKTLHSYARGLLKDLWKKSINIFPKLSGVIRQDAQVLTGMDVDFDKIFHDRDDKNEYIEFYKKRKKYYDDYYGYTDIIFAAVKYLEVHRDEIPKYEQIVVDEFQDFNQLEVSLIDLLSEKSQILLAGDDDQALYDFKSASAKHIRDRHDNKDFGFEGFNLPFCSRCTRVIVDAANDFITSATENKLFTERIRKPFQYFEDEEKDQISEQNPSIKYSQLFARKIPWFIAKKVDEVAGETRSKFSVLIISPTKLQSRMIARSLKGKGFRSVEYTERDTEREPTLLDGLKLLLDNNESNLGWRIVARSLMDRKDFEQILKESTKNEAKTIHELIATDCKKQAKEMFKILKKVKNDKSIDKRHLDTLEKMGLKPFEIIKDSLGDGLNDDARGVINPGLRNISIKSTTVQGSKGLSADYVFITHFDDQYFIDKNGLSDRDVCKFLVALTRAERKVFLISSQKQQPTFLKWIKNERISTE